MKKEKSKKLKIMKAISAIAGTGVAVTAGMIALNKTKVIGGGKSSNPTPIHETLSQVTNLAYDEKTNTLSWDEVKHANMYRVNVNGKQNEVETNSYSFMPADKVSTMRVQALDTTGNYSSSVWSDAITYTIPDNVLSPEAVFSFVDSFDSATDLVNIAGMYIEDNVLYTKTYEKKSDGREYVASRETRFKSDISTLSDAMNAKLLGSDLTLDEHSNYNSAKYLIKSDKYVGLMEKYRQQGYTFEVVSSEVADEGDRRFTIFGTYRLSNGNDVKYLTSSIGCGIKDKSASKSASYTVKLQELSNRTIEEYEAHELTGDLYNWANAIFVKNQAKQNAKAQQVSNIVDNKISAVVSKKKKQPKTYSVDYGMEL